MNAALTRRRALAALLAGFGAARPAAAAGEALRGVYPILQTTYTADGGVDFAALEAEVRFAARAGVHGVVWPQRASQYQFLSQAERKEGAERIVAANRGLGLKVVIGVQGFHTAAAIDYARHAQHLRPDAIVAPPAADRGECDLDEVARYDETIAAVCDLPMFVQTTGNMSVEFVVRLAEKIPTVRYVKDEAGDPMERLGEFAARDNFGRLAVFSGSHGKTLFDELLRGVAGNMPATSWVEFYVQCWDRFHAGDPAGAVEALSRALVFVEQATAYGFPALSYVLHLRGVFPRHEVRGGLRPLDATDKRALEAVYRAMSPDLESSC